MQKTMAPPMEFTKFMEDWMNGFKKVTGYGFTMQQLSLDMIKHFTMDAQKSMEEINKIAGDNYKRTLALWYTAFLPGNIKGNETIKMFEEWDTRVAQISMDGFTMLYKGIDELNEIVEKMKKFYTEQS